MSTRAFITRGMAIAALWLAGTLAAGAQQDDQTGLGEFRRSVDAYVELVARLERTWPRIELSADPREIRYAVETRADGIRRARPHARAGALFNPSVSTLFRSQIRLAFSEPECDASEVWREMTEQAPLQTASVNAGFSWRTAAATPACVLAVLPPLPGQLQYRFVGPSLVLLDITANLVIDVLPDVLDVPPARG